MRIDGDIVNSRSEYPLSPKETLMLAYSVLTENQKKKFETEDELYTCLTGDRPIKVVASAKSKVDQKDYPMAFVQDYGQGRVFHCVLGHDRKAITVPQVEELYRREVTRA